MRLEKTSLESSPPVHSSSDPRHNAGTKDIRCHPQNVLLTLSSAKSLMAGTTIRR